MQITKVQAKWDAVSFNHSVCEAQIELKGNEHVLLFQNVMFNGCKSTVKFAFEPAGAQLHFNKKIQLDAKPLAEINTNARGSNWVVYPLSDALQEFGKSVLTRYFLVQMVATDKPKLCLSIIAQQQKQSLECEILPEIPQDRLIQLGEYTFDLQSLIALTLDKGFPYNPITQKQITDATVVSAIQDWLQMHCIEIKLFDSQNGFYSKSFLPETGILTCGQVRNGLQDRFLTLIRENGTEIAVHALDPKSPFLTAECVICCETASEYTKRSLQGQESVAHMACRLLFVEKLSVGDYVTKYLSLVDFCAFAGYYDQKEVKRLAVKHLTDQLNGASVDRLSELLREFDA